MLKIEQKRTDTKYKETDVVAVKEAKRDAQKNIYFLPGF